jgi:hypothetical protein
MLNGVPASRSGLERYGLCEEFINYTRGWLVVPDAAPAMLLRLLAQRRPIQDIPATEPSDDSDTA